MKFKKIKKSKEVKKEKKLKKIKKEKKVEKFKKIKKPKEQKFSWYIGFVIGKGGAKAIRKLKTNFPEIECWIPTVRRQVAENKRLVVKQFNLYDNYVFVKLPDDNIALQQDIIRKTPILYFVKDGDSNGSLSLEDEIHFSILEEKVVIAIQHDFKSGDSVEVTKGAYEGFVGKIVRIRGGCAVLLLDLHGKQEKVTIGLNEMKLLGSTGEIKIYAEEGDYNVKEGNKV